MAAFGICQSWLSFSASLEGRVVLVLALWPHTEYASLGVFFSAAQKAECSAQTFPGLASLVDSNAVRGLEVCKRVQVLRWGSEFPLEATAARCVFGKCAL